MRRLLSRLRTGVRRAEFRLGARPRRGLRLHLGCGGDYWPGYVNVDADPAAKSDVCLNFTRIGEIAPPESAVEIVMIHSLSYLRLWEAQALLPQLWRLLEPGGRLVIELPDFTKCAAKALQSEGDVPAYLEAVRGVFAFDLDQMARQEMVTPYAFGWSAWHLSSELARAGFTDVRVMDPRTHGPRPWRDTRIEAVK